MAGGRLSAAFSALGPFFTFSPALEPICMQIFLRKNASAGKFLFVSFPLFRKQEMSQLTFQITVVIVSDSNFGFRSAIFLFLPRASSRFLVAVLAAAPIEHLAKNVPLHCSESSTCFDKRPGALPRQ